MITIPCPYAQSIAAYMTLRDPNFRVKVYRDPELKPDGTLRDITKKPVERKGLGENIDTYV